MMHSPQELSTWDDFVTLLPTIGASAHTLYRGLGNSAWKLETTLERRGLTNMPVQVYYGIVSNQVRTQVESATGHRFVVPPYEDVMKLLKEYDSFSLLIGGMPAYDFLIHTRHHGFPSPLLDWTRSPYIAAFFAFAALETPEVPKRSIYVWPPLKFRVKGTDRPELRPLGPYVTTHRRHVLQQCDYAMCATYVQKKKEWIFTSHEEAFKKQGMGDHSVYQYNLPSSERTKVMRFLDLVNINAYSLFGSEEGLMETLAVREFDLIPQRRY